MLWPATQGAVPESSLGSPVGLSGSGAGEKAKVIVMRHPTLPEPAQGLWLLVSTEGSVVKAKTVWLSAPPSPLTLCHSFSVEHLP